MSWQKHKDRPRAWHNVLYRGDGVCIRADIWCSDDGSVWHWMVCVEGTDGKSRQWGNTLEDSTLHAAKQRSMERMVMLERTYVERTK